MGSSFQESEVPLGRPGPKKTEEIGKKGAFLKRKSGGGTPGPAWGGPGPCGGSGQENGGGGEKRRGAASSKGGTSGGSLGKKKKATGVLRGGMTQKAGGEKKKVTAKKKMELGSLSGGGERAPRQEPFHAAKEAGRETSERGEGTGPGAGRAPIWEGKGVRKVFDLQGERTGKSARGETRGKPPSSREKKG